jgi:hypothetical protein
MLFAQASSAAANTEGEIVESQNSTLEIFEPDFGKRRGFNSHGVQAIERERDLTTARPATRSRARQPHEADEGAKQDAAT